MPGELKRARVAAERLAHELPPFRFRAEDESAGVSMCPLYAAACRYCGREVYCRPEIPGGGLVWPEQETEEGYGPATEAPCDAGPERV